MLVIRGRGTDLLLLALEKSKGLLLRSKFRDKATDIKAKARINRHKVGDTSRLLVSQDRGHVTTAT